MPPTHDDVIREEEALLARVREALARAAASRDNRDDGLRSTDALRALRDEARETSADDLPGILHEMSVRQKLREQPVGAPLPDASSPYVAHLRVEDERGERDYFLGHAAFFDARADVRVVDWRTAPIAQVFYKYREGDDFDEEIAERVVSGKVLVRRVVVIEDGQLSRILGDGIAVARTGDRWSTSEDAALEAGGAGTAARGDILGVGVGGRDRAARPDVTALLDAEQHAAIATPPDRALLVIGSAGSGKTTVALHRLARIVATEPARHPIDRVRVVVPEEGLARLSRRLLAPLGVGEAQVETIDAWAMSLARATFGSFPRIGDETPAIVSRLKRHPVLFDALRARLSRLGRDDVQNLKKIRRGLAGLFSDRAFLGTVIDAAAGDLPRGAIEETVRHTMRQLSDDPEKQMRHITDPGAKQTIDGRAVWEGTPQATAGSIDIEDLPIFLAVRAWAAGIEAPRIPHLVVDEAEDVSLFELGTMGRSLEKWRGVTLAGDDVQRTGTGFAGWERALEVLGAKDAATCRLSVSYRCPRPVVELAQRVLGVESPVDAARAARDGAPIGWQRFPDEAHAQLVLASTLRDLAEREPRASVAVIAHDAESARKFHHAVEDFPRTRLVLDGAFTFEPGLDVTHVDAVKGLEWDYVVIPDATALAYPDEPEARRRLHVALTRASYQVWLVAAGEPSPIAWS